ncbi:hypothetical protein ARMGADRAFT_1067008 [Armillaria gallica]|uniref:Uncharacterized protein n=1 Tax=Armillaria gallica TaxID=47427 RepID=A0A2H3CQH1_ARMGA|nr:hypothetical protein ARMGADRAFT_1067008 [Armillaria gallica]
MRTQVHQRILVNPKIWSRGSRDGYRGRSMVHTDGGYGYGSSAVNTVFYGQIRPFTVALLQSSKVEQNIRLDKGRTIVPVFAISIQIYRRSTVISTTVVREFLTRAPIKFTRSSKRVLLLNGRRKNFPKAPLETDSATPTQDIWKVATPAADDSYSIYGDKAKGEHLVRGGEWWPQVRWLFETVEEHLHSDSELCYVGLPTTTK